MTNRQSGGVVRAKHWSSPRSSGVDNPKVCAHLHTTGFWLFLRYRRISSMPCFCERRPANRNRIPRVSVASASLFHSGEALGRTPSERPSPSSTSTIHFMPMPLLVFPAPTPPFLPGKATVEKGLVPLHQSLLVQRSQQALHAFSQTPSSSHCLNRRQQVDCEGNSSAETAGPPRPANPQVAFETSSVGCWRAASSIRSLSRGRKKSCRLPLLVG